MTRLTQDPGTLLTRYADGPFQLEAALADLTEAQLDIAQSAGTWTIRQIVHHVVDGDDLWQVCIKAALGDSDGVFSLQWYWDKPQDTWAETWRYAERAIEPSLALFRLNRRHVVDLLQQIPGVWERRIRVRWPHRPEESVTVRDVVEMQADHALGHVDDICLIRQTHAI